MTTHDINSLMELWNSMFPDYCPPRTQFALWLEMNGADITRKGIVATSKKYIRLGCNMTAEHLSRYASACMRNAKWRKVQQEGMQSPRPVPPLMLTEEDEARQIEDSTQEHKR